MHPPWIQEVVVICVFKLKVCPGVTVLSVVDTGSLSHSDSWRESQSHDKKTDTTSRKPK